MKEYGEINVNEPTEYAKSMQEEIKLLQTEAKKNLVKQVGRFFKNGYELSKTVKNYREEVKKVNEEFNIAEGDDLIYGIAKVTEAYNWMKKNGKDNIADEMNGGNKVIFNEERVEKNADPAKKAQNAEKQQPAMNI